MTNRLTRLAVPALQRTLCTVHWYEQDLKSFLIAALGGTGLMNRTKWDKPKREIIEFSQISRSK